MANPIEHHKNGLARLHQSEEFSDCKLICGPYHFNLHRVILASQFDYFKAPSKQSTFKVMTLSASVHKILTNSWQEGHSGVIELKAATNASETSTKGDDAYDEPEIVKLIVEYLYHFDYLRDTESLPDLSLDSSLDSQVPSQVYIIEHAKVFAIAVKYQIDGLRDLAASKLKEAATAHWNHDDFAHSIHIAFNSTAEEVTQLREVVTDILYQDFDNLEDKVEVETVVCNIPRLAYALLKRSRAGGKNDKKQIQSDALTCDKCGSQFVGYVASELARKNKHTKISWYWPCCNMW